MEMDFQNCLQNAYPEIILHDCKIEKIDVKENIIFHFSHFWVNTEAGEAGRSQQAIISIDLGEDDISCMQYRRFSVLRKLHFSLGRLVNLSSIAKKLRNGSYLEVIDEYYTFNQLYWKCSLKQKRIRKLDDEVVIEAGDWSAINYEWNNG